MKKNNDIISKLITEKGIEPFSEQKRQTSCLDNISMQDNLANSKPENFYVTNTASISKITKLAQKNVKSTPSDRVNKFNKNTLNMLDSAFVDKALKNNILLEKSNIPLNDNRVSKKMSPPMIKTWVNGVYNFNKSLIKNLPSADNIVYKLIKSYFFVYPLWQNINREESEKKSRLLVRRFRRASLNRIAVSKPEIKISSDKLLINLYIFNKRKNTYLYKLNHIYNDIKNSNFNFSRESLLKNVSKPYFGFATPQTSIPVFNKGQDVRINEYKYNNLSLPSSFKVENHIYNNNTLNTFTPFNTSNKGYNSLYNYIIRTKKDISNTLHLLYYGLKKPQIFPLTIKTNFNLSYFSLNGFAIRNVKNYAFYKGTLALNRYLLSEKNKNLSLTIDGKNSKKLENLYHNTWGLPDFESFKYFRNNIPVYSEFFGDQNTHNAQNTVGAHGVNNSNVFVKNIVNKDKSFRGLSTSNVKSSYYSNLNLYNKYKYQIFRYIQPEFTLNQIQEISQISRLTLHNSVVNGALPYTKGGAVPFTADILSSFANKNDIFNFTFNALNKYKLSQKTMAFNYDTNQLISHKNYIDIVNSSTPEGLAKLNLRRNIKQKFNILNLASETWKDSYSNAHTLTFNKKVLKTGDISLNNSIDLVSTPIAKLISLSTAFKQLSSNKIFALNAVSSDNNDIRLHRDNISLPKIQSNPENFKLNFIKSIVSGLKSNTSIFSATRLHPFYITNLGLKGTGQIEQENSENVNLITNTRAPYVKQQSLLKKNYKLGLLNESKQALPLTRFRFIKQLISMDVKSLFQAYSSVKPKAYNLKTNSLNLNGVSLYNNVLKNIIAPISGTNNTTDRPLDLALVNNDSAQGFKFDMEKNKKDKAIIKTQISKFYNANVKGKAFKGKNFILNSASIVRNDKTQNKSNVMLNAINEFTYMWLAFNKLDKFFEKYKSNLIIGEKDRALASTIVASSKQSKIIANVNQDFYIRPTCLHRDYLLSYKKKIINQIANLETTYIHYLTLLEFNSSLFKNWAINPLCNIISRVYNKKVIFNIVSLKAMYLNSDIMSNLISIRLNNHKKNRYNKVFKKILRAIALAKVNEHSYNNQSDIYKSLNKHYHSYFALNNIIGLIPKPINVVNNNTISLANEESSLSASALNNKNYKIGTLKNLNLSLVNTINFIKHKSVFGVRLEASGRLTKRSTASRKIFKARYLGNLRLNNTINRKVPGVIVKDKLTNNLQFSKISSKTRNGAFGIKGWINQA